MNINDENISCHSSLVLFNSAQAFDSAKLRMKIAGPIKDNRYFLCVTNIGCISILNGNKGRSYPLNPGSISNIYTVNATNMRMHTQPLPQSCNREVKMNQTLLVSGKLIEGKNNQVYLSGLSCSVS